ncbi:MAG TPA: cytochrome c [Burkholderiales bacterium]|nr:cytochrome c [Burkholderiales bacterium]
MKRKVLSAALALVVGAGTGYVLNVFAQQKPEVLVGQRQAAMKLQGKYFGPLSGMAQGKIPYDAKIVARNAGYLSALSEMPWDGFTPDTKDTPEKTRALPAIWAEPAKFKEAQEHFQGAVSKLAAASKGGDEGNTKAAIGEVGKACGACHEHFRAK